MVRKERKLVEELISERNAIVELLKEF